MKICIIHQYYKTPKTGGAIRSYYIAKYLKSKGHRVTVITAGNEGVYNVDETNGYPVHYLPVYYENHLGFLSRLHAFFLFAWKAYRMIKKIGSFDLNYVITTPLTTGLIALRAKKKLKIPYVFEVGDLWPEAPIQLGVLKNPILISISQYFEKQFYKKSLAIVALSPGIKEHIEKIVPNKQIEVITNFSDPGLFNIEGLENLTFDKKGQFNISYIGTIGLANHLEFLLDCANEVKKEDVHFIIAGGGAQHSRIKKQAKDRGLTNITFYEPTDKLGVARILSKTDAVYVSFDNAPILGTGSPNKFFDGLATGKIIIVNFKGWIKGLIEKNACGFYYDPLNPDDFRTKLMPYLHSTELCDQSKLNSKKLCDQFTPANQLALLDNILKVHL